MGFGVASTDHEVPFHASARALSTPMAPTPTATQELAEVQSTETRLRSATVPLESALVLMDHEVPFRTSTSVTPIELSKSYPAAVQPPAELQATLRKGA